METRRPQKAMVLKSYIYKIAGLTCVWLWIVSIVKVNKHSERNLPICETLHPPCLLVQHIVTPRFFTSFALNVYDVLL